MGQYYAIYNKTKKEFIGTHSTCSGAKLLEFSQGLTSIALCLLLANSNGRGGGDICAPIKYSKKTYKPLKKQPATTVMMLSALEEIQGRWAGDEILIQGDYAEEGDPSYITEEEINAYTDISKEALKAISVNQWISEDIEKDYFGKQVSGQFFASTANRER